jgi:hypothetical protein
MTTDDADIVFKGRRFSADELALVQEVVGTCGGLSVQELANTVSELLGWRRAAGGLKTWECRELLQFLAESGRIELPAVQPRRPFGSKTSVPRTTRGEPRSSVSGTVRDVGTVLLRRVSTPSERELWRELVGRYHYLGHAVPFGAHLRYLIEVSAPEPEGVGCVQLSSAAWRMATRDRWIGWTDAARRARLQLVVSQSRFLILPWVTVKNLASTVLSKMAREFPADWEQVYGLRPVLLETLVDPARYTGTCYRAANWIELGATSGRGRMDRAHARHGEAPKTVFVYPLQPDAREVLRGER